MLPNASQSLSLPRALVLFTATLEPKYDTGLESLLLRGRTGPRRNKTSTFPNNMP